MVDLAYWSDFDTSRRDAASAFATLSMNGEQAHCIMASQASQLRSTYIYMSIARAVKSGTGEIW